MIALIVLVAMTLAALGLIRSIDTGTLVAGNIGYRESTVHSGDTGIELARQWLITNVNTLDNDSPTFGYYASRQDSVDITGNKTLASADGVDWGGTNPTATVKAYDAGTSNDGTGNHVFYLIQRMCTYPGAAAGIVGSGATQSCTTATVNAVGSTQSASDYSGQPLYQKEEVYYRVTSRVTGPKNSVSYVQAFIEM